MPRLTAKLKLRESSAGKIEKDMIQTLLDQKKNMMARIKTEKVSALKIY